MSRHATDAPGPGPECANASSPPLPADHVLDSGAVLFPGAFDQHGCPLIVFPVDGQATLSTQLSKSEVVDFINYFQRAHNKKLEKECLVSLVADLRHASLPTVRFIAETLVLLELHKRTVHSVYIIQPQKKEALKLLTKLLTPPKKVLLKDISELSNYIDKSQLPASLGGYLIYSHPSWVAFVKEMDTFVQEFVSVVQRLPSCISALYALSRSPLPSTFTELQSVCCSNEATFQQLRRELGLDELLRHCETVMEKLHYPEKDPFYLAMAGTALFAHTTFDMLQNHSRITAAVEKVELLWQQAFAKARLQLQVFQLREDALQITEQIKSLHQEKLQPYKIEVAKDEAKALKLVSEFEATIYTPAVALVRCAEDVIHTLAEIMPFDGPIMDHWVLDLERLKEKVYSAVQFILQTLRSVSKYHRSYKMASRWYSLVLQENILQELLSGVGGDHGSLGRQRRSWAAVPEWRRRISAFLAKHPPPDKGQLVHLAHLSRVIPDEEARQAGRQMSQRCIALRKLLVSSEPVAVGCLQRALQWQYQLLRGCSLSVERAAVDGAGHTDGGVTLEDRTASSPRAPLSVELASAHSTPVSISSFDSGFDGVGNGPLEFCSGGERAEDLCGLNEITDSEEHALLLPQINEGCSACSDVAIHDDEFDCGSVGNSSAASVQILPKAAAEGLNFEIRVRRSPALPSNPWLSLPVENPGNSYTITITPSPAPQKKSQRLQDLTGPPAASGPLSRCRSRPTQTEALSSVQPGMPSPQSSAEDPDLSPAAYFLSSTITEDGNRSLCTTEGAPTLLWDSYDLHEQNQDSLDLSSIDASLKDWDVKEQANLREVEKILGRTGEILETEENVLAQEAVLDALLNSESQHQQWMWDEEIRAGGTASGDLAEAGFLGLEDLLSPDPARAPKLTASEGGVKVSDDRHDRADPQVFHSSSDLLTELRHVHMLDEMIVDERLKIQMFRETQRPEEEPSRSRTRDSDRLGSVRKEKEAFRFQLEKEKQAVVELEKSLRNELRAKKQKDQPRKVIRCSVMGKTQPEEPGPFPVCRGSEPEPQTEQGEGVLRPQVLAANKSHRLAQLPASQADHFESKTLVWSAGIPDVEAAQPLEGAFNGNPAKPEASLTPELGAGNEGFDPGGSRLVPPVPAPGQDCPVKDNPSEGDTPCSADMRSSSLPPVPDPVGQSADGHSESSGAHRLSLAADVKERRHRNDHNPAVAKESDISVFTGTSAKEGADASVEFGGLEEEDLQLPREMRTLSPAGRRLLPEPEFCGRDHRDEDLSEGVQPSDWLKASGCQSADSEDVCFKKITDFKTPIVLDTGSGLMKAGFADEDLPNVVFPTIIGMPKYEEIVNGGVERETYIGHEAQHMRGVLALKRPIKNGIVQNWDEMEKIWHHTFLQMGVDPEDHPVLLTEAAMNPLENRRRMVEIMFECFSVPFAYVAMQAVLSLYASGTSTGVVFDSGDGVSHSVPVFDGHYLPHAVQRFPLAGVDVTLHLIKLLQEQGVCMRTTAEAEIVREMKEKCCRVALNYEAELSAGESSCSETHFTMPDGQVVTLSTERFRAPEILFKPELIGRDHGGIHESLYKSILSSDMDLRRSLLQNIVLSGGNTLLSGFPERLQAEIKGLLGPDAGERIHVSSPKDRDFSVWSGGAMLASLPTFGSAWISVEEYEEHGPQIVHRKCF